MFRRTLSTLWGFICAAVGAVKRHWLAIMTAVGTLAGVVSAGAAALATYYAWQSVAGAQRLEAERRASVRPYLTPTNPITDDKGFHVTLTNSGAAPATLVKYAAWGIRASGGQVLGQFTFENPHDIFIGAFNNVNISPSDMVRGDYLVILVSYTDGFSNIPYSQTLFLKSDSGIGQTVVAFGWDFADAALAKRMKDALVTWGVPEWKPVIMQ